MDILFLSHTYKGGDFFVGSHHLAREMAARGHSVAHVSTPLSGIHALLGRSTEQRTEQARRGVFVDDDGVVNVVPSVAVPSDVVWTDAQYRRVLGRIGFTVPDIVFVDQPALFTRAQTESTLVFRPTDIFTRPSLIRRAHQLNEAAHGLVATSEPVRREFTRGDGRPEIVVPNGVQLDKFLGGVEPAERHGAVYVGAVDVRFDTDAVIRLAVGCPELRVDIFGPVTIEIDSDSLPPNLVFHGATEYSTLPSLLRQYKIGLLPFNSHPLNVGRGPMKLYEYLAAGLSVLLSSTNEGSAISPGVHVYRSPEDMVPLARSITAVPGKNDDGLSTARDHSWSAKAERILDFAEGLTRRP